MVRPLYEFVIIFLIQFTEWSESRRLGKYRPTTILELNASRKPETGK